MASIEDQLRCLQHSDKCKGEVEYRYTPDRQDFKAFPRCEYHFEKRLAEVERNLELQADVPPKWFDPAYAGERWEEDY